METERRRHPRVPDSRKILAVCGETVFEALLVNVSTLGALAVVPPAGITVGAGTHLRIPLAAGATLLAEGRVVRVDAPARTVAFSFERPVSEFPVEAAPVKKTAGARDILTACVVAIVFGLVVGGLVLLVRG